MARGTSSKKARTAVEPPAPPLSVGGPGTSIGPALTEEDLARNRALTKSDVTGPLPLMPFVAPEAAANDDGLPILLGYQGR